MQLPEGARAACTSAGTSLAHGLSTNPKAVAQRAARGAKRQRLPWSEAENTRLVQDVRQMGSSWAAIAAHSCWDHRTAQQLRCRWAEISSRHMERQATAKYGSPTVDQTDMMDAAATAQMRAQPSFAWAFDGATSVTGSEQVMAARHGRHAELEPRNCMGAMRLTGDNLGLLHRQAGRSLASALERSSMADARVVPTPQHQRWIRQWRLSDDAGRGGFIICNFRSAARKLYKDTSRSHPGWSHAQVLQSCNTRWLTVQQRDDLGLACGPREQVALHTFLASGASLTWIGGPAAGDGCYLSACTVAALMGFKVNTGIVLTARRLLCEREVFRALGDSLHLPFAEALVCNGVGRLRAELLGTASYTYGSFFSGCIDAFAEATRRVLGRVTMQFASELERQRRLVLREGYGFQEVHSTAMAAAMMAPPAFIVSWTASCRPLSQAPAVATADRAAKLTTACESVEEALEPLRAYVARCMPVLIVGENTSGMVTHHRSAHGLVVEGLMSMPYACWTEMVDCADRFRAAHHRNRVGWVLVRMDALGCRVPRACVGRWWLDAGECASCGAGLLAGACILEECCSAAHDCDTREGDGSG